MISLKSKNCTRFILGCQRGSWYTFVSITEPIQLAADRFDILTVIAVDIRCVRCMCCLWRFSRVGKLSMTQSDKDVFLSLPSSASHDPAVGERHSGGGSWAGFADVLWHHRGLPGSHCHLGALPRTPPPQCPGPRANADPAGRHSGWRRILQLHSGQQCGQPGSQERQCHCQE